MATRQGAAVDKWPAAARLWTVATAGHLPTAIIHHDWGHGPVYGVNDEGTTGFTSFGIENLKELIEMHKADPTILKRYPGH